MSPLAYFAPPILFILLCMALLRWAGACRSVLSWMVRSSGRWIVTWSMIGFAVASSLGVVAWVMDTDDVMSKSSLVWPFCITLMALDGHPSTGALLLVVSIAALENAVLYLILAALVWGFWSWIPRIWRTREEPPSVLGR